MRMSTKQITLPVNVLSLFLLLYGYRNVCCNGTKISKNLISKHTIMLLNYYTNLSPSSTSREQHFFSLVHHLKTDSTFNQQFNTLALSIYL